MGKLFGPKGQKPDRPGPVTVTAPLPPAAVADALREEQEALLRRVSVCTELRQVAVEKGDDALARQADELERQAKALYLARVAGLGVPRADKAPLPESQPAPAGEQTVAARARRLAAPAAPTPAATASAKVWEVRP